MSDEAIQLEQAADDELTKITSNDLQLAATAIVLQIRAHRLTTDEMLRELREFNLNVSVP